MAKIITEGVVREWGVWAQPKCSGCGEKFEFIPAMLDSRIRGPAFGPDARRAGSKGAEIAEWAKKHEACPDPVEETLPNGIRFIDRRRSHWRKAE
jgi:hypothetical protein